MTLGSARNRNTLVLLTPSIKININTYEEPVPKRIQHRERLIILSLHHSLLLVHIYMLYVIYIYML